MSTHSPSRTRFIAALLALLTQSVMLGWETLNGGVAAHHLLGDPTLPAVSNLWGLLLLPLLAWWTVSQVQRRAERETTPPRLDPVFGFYAALLYAGMMALVYSQAGIFAVFLVVGIVMYAAIARLWHAQYLLGFVFGMAFVLGPVQSALLGAVVGLLAWVVHAVTGPLRRRILPRFGVA